MLFEKSMKLPKQIVVSYLGPVIKLIGILPPVLGNSNMIKYLIYNIIFQCGLVTYGRPELYVIINPASYMVILEDICLDILVFENV